MIQSKRTLPPASVLRIISAAICGFVWNFTARGTRVFLRRRWSAPHSSVRNNCASNAATPAGVTPARNTPTWQFVVFPTRPHHWSATPTLSVPALTNPDSSITPTVPIDHCAVLGTNSSANTAWISANTSPASQGEAVTNPCKATTSFCVAAPPSERRENCKTIGSTLLRSKLDNNPFR